MDNINRMEWPKPYGGLALTFGVIIPAITILVELITEMCATTFFDPLPTWPMTLLVMSVPLVNLHLWFASKSKANISNWILWLYGASFTISLVYTLIMLPLYPIAAIGVIYFGIGLLPMAPLFTAIFMGVGINRLSAIYSATWKHFSSGMGVGLLLLIMVDLPVSATRIALDMAQKENDARAVSLMRWIGSEYDLLQLAHGSTGRAGGLSSIILEGSWGFGFWGSNPIRNDTITARQLYFQTTGQAYNSPENTKAITTKTGRWSWDSEQGGDIVGGYVETLSLASSRIDGSISAQNNIAYSEWTVEIANNHEFQDGEARFTIVLPEGGVASRATLWVNGEPREASIAGRAEVKEAYKSIVQRQRDPLLVTTSGNGRLLVQAFPVPRNGVMKFRIGFSAPLKIANDGARSIAMPAIVEQNFRIADNLKHSIWMEGDVPTNQSGWKVDTAQEGATRLRASLDNKELRYKRPHIAIDRIDAPSFMTATIDSKKKEISIAVKQSIVKKQNSKLDSLTILLDGSNSNKETSEALVNSLDAIAPQTSVGLKIATDDTIEVEHAIWSTAQKTKFIEAISNTDFSGGFDNVPAFADILDNDLNNNEAILWIHGPQPIEFPASKARLEQIIERSGSNKPKLLRYQAQPGRAFTIQAAGIFETAREISPSGNIETDLRTLLSDISSRQESWQIERSITNEKGPGSAHIVRLWAADKLAIAGLYQDEEREEAIDLAHNLNIITPVSGAVVLETDKDYDENGLPIPSSDEVPSIPEPHEWVLIILLILFVGWTLHRRGYSFTQLFPKQLANQ